MDEIVIDIPRERPFSAVADLVLGGLAARHEVTLDVLDDLQLALGSLLDHGEDDEGEITVVLRVAGNAIEASVGPLGDRTAAELEADAGQGLGLRRLLEAVVDEFAVSSRDGGAWIDLRKGYALAGAEG
ncbi:MAG: hypothetical protein ACYC1P_07495 [Gaiellaceae bacterium]